MNDEGGNTNPCREIDLNLSSRTIHNTLYGVYGVNTPTELISRPLDEEKWFNFIYKKRLLTNSVSNLNECGIEVDYSNRDKIIHNYE